MVASDGIVLGTAPAQTTTITIGDLVDRSEPIEIEITSIGADGLIGGTSSVELPVIDNAPDAMVVAGTKDEPNNNTYANKGLLAAVSDQSTPLPTTGQAVVLGDTTMARHNKSNQNDAYIAPQLDRNSGDTTNSHANKSFTHIAVWAGVVIVLAGSAVAALRHPRR